MKDSDLIGVEFTAAVGLWILAVLAAFFFVGPVVGIIAILVGIAAFGSWLVRTIGRSELD